ncbi:MAG: hypothetical protein Q4Q06_01285 [Bacteroidota bacterium]|nr:hypothetical protein [Bacteroidota bacterium]
MFSLQRSFLLLRRDLLVSIKTLLSSFCALVIMAAILMILGCISIPGQSMITDDFNSFYMYFTVATVVLVGVLAFRSYDKPYNRSLSILLPLSNEEKFLTNFILSFLIIPILVFVALFIGMEIGHLVNYLRFEEYHFLYKESFYSFSKYDSYLQVYLLLSFSFLGAIIFKKNKLIKTWAIVFGAFFLLLLGSVFYIYFNFPNIIGEELIIPDKLQIIVDILCHIIFFLCLVGTYLKLRKERS